ncbi:MAG TPA: hypothetical protein PLG05_03310 [Bacteroidales bacterium]|nr:hypothetical protein [Bacteroidales bacterium]HOR59669.1 hypothetical protein [Bacteroidales bacterium]HPL04184.1 hypothetical protein [Bacteroidales bacterium]HPX77093.1 hypothetical protein [Bacteroidales bacterium]HQB20908.1 hypothetical protein [Bacteroidales bacterium]
MRLIILNVCLIILSLNLYSQINLSLLNGQQKTLDSYVFRSDEGVEYMEFTFTKPNGKVKTSYIDCESVYSLSIDGKDSIFYYPIDHEEFSVEQMSVVVNARQLAIKEYKPWLATVGGLLIGSASMFIPLDPFTRLLIPVGYSVTMAFVKPPKSYVTNHYPQAADDEWFVYGYQNVGRKKIFKNTLIGTLGGVFVSGVVVGTLYLINPDK